MLAKAKIDHANIQALFKSNFVATYNIRSPKQDSEKKIVLYKKGDDSTRFDGSYPPTGGLDTTLQVTSK